VLHPPRPLGPGVVPTEAGAGNGREHHHVVSYSRYPRCHLKPTGAWSKLAQAAWRLCSSEIAALVIAITEARGHEVEVPTSATKAVTLAELVTLCQVYSSPAIVANLIQKLERTTGGATEEIRSAIRRSMTKTNAVRLSHSTEASIDALLSVPWRTFNKSLLVDKRKVRANDSRSGAAGAKTVTPAAAAVATAAPVAMAAAAATAAVSTGTCGATRPPQRRRSYFEAPASHCTGLRSIHRCLTYPPSHHHHQLQLQLGIVLAPRRPATPPRLLRADRGAA